MSHYLNGGKLRHRDLMVIANMVSELHYRNRAYANESGAERIEVAPALITASRLHDFAGTHLAPDDRQTDRGTQLEDALYRAWRFAILPIPSGQVLTTDNPAIRFVQEGYMRPILFALPFDPMHWLFLYDHTRSELLSSTPSVQDMLFLRVAGGAVSGCFISVTEIDLSERAHAIAALGHGKSQMRGAVTATYVDALSLPAPALSFWRPCRASP